MCAFSSAKCDATRLADPPPSIDEIGFPPLDFQTSIPASLIKQKMPSSASNSSEGIFRRWKRRANHPENADSLFLAQVSGKNGKKRFLRSHFQVKLKEKEKF